MTNLYNNIGQRNYKRLEMDGGLKSNMQVRQSHQYRKENTLTLIFLKSLSASASFEPLGDTSRSSTDATAAAWMHGREEDREAAQTLLGISYGREEVNAARALLAISQAIGESIDEESGPVGHNVENDVLYLRCHGKKTHFHGVRGNAIHVLIQSKHEKDLSVSGYRNEAGCNICRLDKKAGYPRDDPEATEGESSAIDVSDEKRRGAGKHENRQSNRLEFGQPGKAGTGSSRRCPQPATKKTNAGQTKPGLPLQIPSPLNPSPPLPPSRKRSASQSLDSLPKRTRSLTDTPTPAPTPSLRFQRELTTTLLHETVEADFPGDASLGTLRKSHRVKKQSVKARENSIF